MALMPFPGLRVTTTGARKLGVEADAHWNAEEKCANNDRNKIRLLPSCACRCHYAYKNGNRQNPKNSDYSAPNLRFHEWQAESYQSSCEQTARDVDKHGLQKRHMDLCGDRRSVQGILDRGKQHIRDG